MPARFRKSLSAESDETFVVTLAPNECLRAYPLDEWIHIEKKYKKLKQTPRNVQLLRRIYATMSETTLDSQGRITLTPQQIAYAGIDKKVTLMGYPSENCIEISAPVELDMSGISDMMFDAFAELEGDDEDE